MKVIARLACAVGTSMTAVVLASPPQSPTPAASSSSPIVFSGAGLIDGTGAPVVPNSVIVVRDGKIEGIGRVGSVRPPAGARTIDVTGKFVMPGLISTHAHVSDVQGIRPRAYTEENTQRQLGVYARYGVTTVWSLGGERVPAFQARETQTSSPSLNRARVFLAGDVITGSTADEARRAIKTLNDKTRVATVSALKPDIIKIRVDDNLGTATKMTPEVYRAVIDEAHNNWGQRVAAHIFYLDDAKDLLRAGVDMIAHSVRDKDLDDEFIALMKARNVPYCPTLTRELAAFVYESTPAFFADPFFQKEADRDLVAQLQEPARQAAMRSSQSAQRYKAALVVARRNLKRAADAGLLIAMGTDSGAFPERFQGYFEHLEMEMMVESGLTPPQVLRSATGDAARAMKNDGLGILKPGAWADLVVLDRNPLVDIRNTRSIASVWIAGTQIAR